LAVRVTVLSLAKAAPAKMARVKVTTAVNCMLTAGLVWVLGAERGG
jgi:hypothetical protein